MRIRQRTYFECDACDLSDLIEEVYGVEFNIPYLIMQGDNKTEASVAPEKMPDELLAEFKSDKGPTKVSVGIYDLFESILNDLCFQGKLEEGEYLLCFND